MLCHRLLYRVWSLKHTPKTFLVMTSFQSKHNLNTMESSVFEQTQQSTSDRLTSAMFAVKMGPSWTQCCGSVTDALKQLPCWFLFSRSESSYFTETLTTFPLVSCYDAVGHNVEDCKQEEANLKWQHKILSQGFTMTVDESEHYSYSEQLSTVHPSDFKFTLTTSCYSISCTTDYGIKLYFTFGIGIL